MMNTLLITYDLIGKEPASRYTKLQEAIGKLGEGWMCLQSVAVINTTLNHVQVRDTLLKYLDSNDKLLVVTLAKGAAWTTSLDRNCAEWLKRSL